MDEFDDNTPLGKKRFTNIIATQNPAARRRLILSAHYDSKLMQPSENGEYFLGAIDSAVPCAMLVEIARTLTPLFNEKAKRQVHFKCFVVQYKTISQFCVYVKY